MTKPRKPVCTFDFIDKYCQIYQNFFDDVRNFEYFKFLHIGILAHQRPKSFDGIARIIGLKNGQRLKAFFDSPRWELELIRQTRLAYIKQSIREQETVLCLNEWGVHEHDESIDYVCHQHLNHFDIARRGIISINSYVILDEDVSPWLCTYPLLFQVFKPQSRLKIGDEYRSKSQLAMELSIKISQLKFKPKLVLADKFRDDEAEGFADMLQHSNTPYILAIHSSEDDIVVPTRLTPNEQLKKYREIFTDNTNQEYQVRKISTGGHKNFYYYEVSKASTKNSAHTKTCVIQSNLKISDVREAVNRRSWWFWNNRFHERSLVTLGWMDIRATDYFQIERWWELIFSAYLIGSLWANRDKTQQILALTDNTQKSMVDFPFGELLRAQLSIH